MKHTYRLVWRRTLAIFVACLQPGFPTLIPCPWPQVRNVCWSRGQGFFIK
jgi:hypothetical protein